MQTLLLDGKHARSMRASMEAVQSTGKKVAMLILGISIHCKNLGEILRNYKKVVIELNLGHLRRLLDQFMIDTTFLEE